ncbi:hypothetical protein BKA70DRAFT_1574797 [Coprinopsis sp. MPI-PUGE-AT-0042]|nr:hypothetical protein BKA70DRAFT_1574797 [Coprinopsis sp. MPI-PUGE-AT-0042]
MALNPATPSHPSTNRLDAIPPEIWRETTGLLASRKGENQILLSCALFSKKWNEIARPFIFKTLEVEATWANDCLSDRVDVSHDIFDRHSGVASCFRLIVRLSGGSVVAIGFLQMWGERLLALIKRLPIIKHFILDPDDGSVEAWSILFHYFFFEEIQRRSTDILFRQVCSLPTLQHLDVRGVEFPLAMFIHNLNLCDLTVVYGSTVIQEDPPPSQVSEIPSANTPQLSSSSMVLQGLQDEDEVSQCALMKTLPTLLGLHPGLFRSLNSFEAVTLVEDIEDIRRFLRETKGTLRHFACGISWQSLAGPKLDASLTPSPVEIEEVAKLDFTPMTQLLSLELRYDSPNKIGFPSAFPPILSTLRTLPWKQLEQLTLVKSAICPEENHGIWDFATYISQLDAFISPHVLVREQQQGLHDIPFWILKNCADCEDPGIEDHNADPSNHPQGRLENLFSLLAKRAHS